MSELPNVHIIQEPEKIPAAKSFVREWVLNPKVIYLLLGLVILVEIGIGIKTLLTPIPKSSASTIQPLSEGKLALISRKNAYKVNDLIPVAIKLSTGGYTTDGSDVVIRFDPNILEASAGGVIKGKIYNEYPGISVDNKKGEINLSGIVSSRSRGYNGTGGFATVLMKAKKEGQTTVVIYSQKGSTTDSNIIETKSVNDILGYTYNLDLTIGSNITNNKSGSNLRCNGFRQVCLDANGRQGTQLCTGGKTEKNQCTWDPNLTISCGACQIRTFKQAKK